MEQGRKSTCFKLLIVCMGIVLFGSFWLTARGASGPVSLTVMPQVPREGELVVATFKLGNASSEPLPMRYQFYANGELAKEGVTTIAPTSSEVHQYSYENSLAIGEQVNFMVKAQSERGDYQKTFSTPPYPPQVWSSFTSFASFSTTVMSSISTMTYYQSEIADNTNIGVNVGLIASAVLIVLLVFLELTHPVIQGKTVASLGRLRVRFSTVTWILFIVFLGTIYTKTVLLITGVSN